jgi:hypothetical protein
VKDTIIGLPVAVLQAHIYGVHSNNKKIKYSRIVFMCESLAMGHGSRVDDLMAAILLACYSATNKKINKNVVLSIVWCV